MTTNLLSGGQLVVAALRAHRVDTAFSVAGESYLEVLDALFDAPEIRLVTCRQEGGAAFMAEAYGKLTGKPGVLLVTRGPGACNASIGIHTAFQDSTPMVVLVGQVARHQIDREAFQEVDFRKMFAPLAKWAAQIDIAERVPELINQAFQVATSGRPGPAVLALPEDMLRDRRAATVVGSHRPVRAHPGSADLAEMCRLLAAAERPMMLVGGSSWTDEACRDIANFARANDLPVCCSFRRQDIVDNRLPCFVGDLGTGASPALVARLKEADLLLAVGARIGEITSQSYSLMGIPDPGKVLIHVHAAPFDQFLKRFFEQPFQFRNPAEKVMALGSGFMIDPAGYIVTNNHVVANADKVSVIFQDNSRHTAKVIGRDQKTDMALLKIDTNRKLPYVTWGNSDDAKVGDWVVAVGNPFGLGGTVTAGIISALGRNINEGPYDDFLQIDAPINRGNSGGPTFDLHGRIIGINTAIYSPSGGSVGIGFAVPSNTAKYVVAQLKEHGHVTWGWLGVAIQNITPSIAKGLRLNPEQATGALIATVTPDSPAARAGLKSGDIITAAGGHEIKAVHDLPRLVASTPIGTKLSLTVLRNGKEQTLEATIGEMPQNTAAAEPNEQPSTALGLELVPLTPELRGQLRVPKDVDGVVVGRIASDSPARQLGVQPGDVIVSVDQKAVTTPEEAATRLKEAAAQGNILLLLNRHGSSEFVGLSIENNGVAGSSR